MSDVDWEALRAPFGPDKINKLPKGKGSGDKADCSICGNYHYTRGMIHLDYIGHAYITERLNEAGGDWSMVPEGGVQFPSEDLCWMEVRLTIGGVTRSEVGCADPGKEEWPKHLWSDCLTRVAMRFGIGLALWQKEPLPQDRSKSTRAAQPPRGATPPAPAPTPPPAPAPASPPDPDLVALLEVLQGDVDALDMASKDSWETWKGAHANWWKSMDSALDARNFVMGLLDGKPSGPDLDSGTLLG